MPIEDSATAKSIAASDKHLESLSVLCGILAAGIDRSRRDLRQIRSDATAAQQHEEKGRGAIGEISPDMLG